VAFSCKIPQISGNSGNGLFLAKDSVIFQSHPLPLQILPFVLYHAHLQINSSNDGEPSQSKLSLDLAG
jgi:hypothetical protein